MSRITPDRISERIAASVLYLRAFGDDGTTAQVASDNPFWPFSVRTGEERLVRALRETGEVVAVGRPGEQVPELGADRTYLTDAEWRPVVSSWIAEARLVVIRIGAGDGLWWEIETSLATRHTTRLGLLVPNAGAVYRSFRQRLHAEHAGRYSVPDVPGLLAEGTGVELAGMIHFDRRGVGSYRRLPRSTRGMRRVLAPLVGPMS